MEVSFQLGIEGHRRARHVKSKRKGHPDRGNACKDQHTKQGAAAEGPGCPVAHGTGPSCHLSVLPAPNLTPSHLGLCSPDNSKQTGLTLGLMTLDWSWENRAAQQSWTLWDRPGLRRAMPRGKVRGRGHLKQPSQASCIPQGRAWGIWSGITIPTTALGLGGSSKNHLRQPSSGTHASPWGAQQSP